MKSNHDVVTAALPNQHIVRRAVWTNDRAQPKASPPSRKEEFISCLSPFFKGHRYNRLLQVITYINEAAPPSITKYMPASRHPGATGPA